MGNCAQPTVASMLRAGRMQVEQSIEDWMVQLCMYAHREKAIQVCTCRRLAVV